MKEQVAGPQGGRGPVAARRPPRLGAAVDPRVWGALSIVYAVWGSTYLAIRVAINTLPPLLMAGVRFLIAGTVLFLWAIRRGDRDADRPEPAQWAAAAIVGGALLLGGNGMVVLAERTVPSGTVALLVATVPLWMVVIGRLAFGDRLGLQAALGFLLGFAGLVLLVGLPGPGSLDRAGVTFGLLAPLAWAAGSLYSRRARLPARPLVSTAMQMIAGGLLLAVTGIARGELSGLDPSAFSLRSLLALGYLIVFGSWLGFSAYVWLLRAAPVSIVSTYAYVNPVVAVLLGWAILAEPIGARTLVAGAIIIVAVALIVTGGSVQAERARRRRRAEP